MKIVAVEIDSVGNDIDYTFLSKAGDTLFYPDKITNENSKERLKDAEVLCINKSQITEEILNNAPKLKLICMFATGFDNANVSACKAHGIDVANVKGYSTDSVAQHTFALLFYLIEKLRHYDDFVRSGDYGAQEHFCLLDQPFNELAGKTYGIIGMGNIGRKVAQIATAFDAKVIFYASSGHSDCTDYEQVSFEELLERSDIISLHCPLTDRTLHLMNDEAFSKMKDSAILINVARGAVIDDDALHKAITTKKIAGAGIDVLAKEPIASDNPLTKLYDYPNVVITPHMAWASVEARSRCVKEVAENIKSYENGIMRNIVTR
ncbi:MAG: D-2-hydroxyacid dehydrogenase [Butyrivibrio sp.]|nr:D-2-hydroxyacid dehydrogenase [Butyrivibrio sp.]